MILTIHELANINCAISRLERSMAGSFIILPYPLIVTLANITRSLHEVHPALTMLIVTLRLTLVFVSVLVYSRDVCVHFYPRIVVLLLIVI